jgi:hypothetical protein
LQHLAAPGVRQLPGAVSSGVNIMLLMFRLIFNFSFLIAGNHRHFSFTLHESRQRIAFLSRPKALVFKV